MKFVIGSNELKSALKDISGALHAKETIESFHFVHIACYGNELCFTAQNARYSISRRVTYAESGGEGIWAEGDALVQGDTLRQFAALLPTGTCSVETDGKKAVLRSGGSRVTLLCWQGETKPFREALTEGKRITLPWDALVQGLKAVRYARAGAQEARDWMKGMLLSAHSSGILFFTAMDGFRLAMRKVACKTSEDFSATLPAEVCDDILTLASGQRSGEVTLIFSETGVTYQGENVTLNSGLLAGTWPNVKTLFPAPDKVQFACRIPRKALLGAAERATIFSAGHSVIRLEVRSNGLWVKSWSEMGESLEDVGGTVSGALSGAESDEALMCIGLNPRYLRDVLSAIDADEIQMNIVGEISPMVVYPLEGPEERHLLLPVRILSHNT